MVTISAEGTVTCEGMAEEDLLELAEMLRLAKQDQEMTVFTSYVVHCEDQDLTDRIVSLPGASLEELELARELYDQVALAP